MFDLQLNIIIQNDPYVMHKIFDTTKFSPEALARMSFEEKYEGFCVELIKVRLNTPQLANLMTTKLFSYLPSNEMLLTADLVNKAEVLNF